MIIKNDNNLMIKKVLGKMLVVNNLYIRVYLKSPNVYGATFTCP